MNKKKSIKKYIEKMSISNGISSDGILVPLEEDPAWIGLKDTFHLGFPNLSENVDALLYRLDGEN